MTPRASLRAAAPKNNTQLIAFLVSVIISLSSGAGLGSMLGQGMTKEQAEVFVRRLGENSLAVESVKREQDRARVEIKRVGNNQILTAKTIYQLNHGSPAYEWPKPDPDNWTVGVEGVIFRTREAWKSADR